MFCKNCGSPLDDNASFCGNCGAKVSPKSKKKHSPVKYVLLILALLLVCGGLYATVGLNLRKNNLMSKIEESKIDEYVTAGKRLNSQWDKLGITDFSDKNDLLKDFKAVNKNVSDFQSCSKEVKTMQEEKANYDLAHENYEEYEKLLSDCADAIKEKDASGALELFQEVKQSFSDLKAANDDYIDDRIDTYENLDLKDAEDKVKTSYDKNLSKILIIRHFKRHLIVWIRQFSCISNRKILWRSPFSR